MAEGSQAASARPSQSPDSPKRKKKRTKQKSEEGHHGRRASVHEPSRSPDGDASLSIDHARATSVKREKKRKRDGEDESQQSQRHHHQHSHPQHEAAAARSSLRKRKRRQKPSGVSPTSGSPLSRAKSGSLSDSVTNSEVGDERTSRHRADSQTLLLIALPNGKTFLRSLQDAPTFSSLSKVVCAKSRAPAQSVAHFKYDVQGVSVIVEDEDDYASMRHCACCKSSALLLRATLRQGRTTGSPTAATGAPPVLNGPHPVIESESTRGQSRTSTDPASKSSAQDQIYTVKDTGHDFSVTIDLPPRNKDASRSAKSSSAVAATPSASKHATEGDTSPDKADETATPARKRKRRPKRAAVELASKEMQIENTKSPEESEEQAVEAQTKAPPAEMQTHETGKTPKATEDKVQNAGAQAAAKTEKEGKRRGRPPKARIEGDAETSKSKTKSKKTHDPDAHGSEKGSKATPVAKEIDSAEPVASPENGIESEPKRAREDGDASSTQKAKYSSASTKHPDYCRTCYTGVHPSNDCTVIKGGLDAVMARYEELKAKKQRKIQPERDAFHELKGWLEALSEREKLKRDREVKDETESKLPSDTAASKGNESKGKGKDEEMVDAKLPVAEQAEGQAKAPSLPQSLPGKDSAASDDEEEAAADEIPSIYPKLPDQTNSEDELATSPLLEAYNSHSAGDNPAAEDDDDVHSQPDLSVPIADASTQAEPQEPASDASSDTSADSSSDDDEDDNDDDADESESSSSSGDDDTLQEKSGDMNQSETPSATQAIPKEQHTETTVSTSSSQSSSSSSSEDGSDDDNDEGDESEKNGIEMSQEPSSTKAPPGRFGLGWISSALPFSQGQNQSQSQTSSQMEPPTSPSPAGKPQQPESKSLLSSDSSTPNRQQQQQQQQAKEQRSQLRPPAGVMRLSQMNDSSKRRLFIPRLSNSSPQPGTPTAQLKHESSQAPLANGRKEKENGGSNSGSEAGGDSDSDDSDASSSSSATSNSDSEDEDSARRKTTSSHASAPNGHSSSQAHHAQSHIPAHKRAGASSSLHAKKQRPRTSQLARMIPKNK